MKKYKKIKKNTNINIYTGDCVSMIPDKIVPDSISVIVTSPPYNLGINYSKYNDRISRDDYLLWASECRDIIYNALNKDGSLFLNLGSKPSDQWVALDVANIFREKFSLQNTIHWIKSISISEKQTGCLNEDISVGHFKPINSHRFINDCHEFIFHFTKTKNVKLDRLSIGVPYQDKSNASRWSTKEDLRCRGNNWFLPYKTIKAFKDRPHPATFPYELPEYCMKLHGVDRIKSVMDPFLGLGSTLVAFKKLFTDNNIKFFGFDIDDDYCEYCRNI